MSFWSWGSLLYLDMARSTTATDHHNSKTHAQPVFSPSLSLSLSLSRRTTQEFQQRKQAEREAAKKDKGEEGEEKKEKEKEGGEEEEEEEEELTLDEATAQRLREEEEGLMERLRINPNAFLPLKGVEDQDQQAKDEEQVRVLGRFLWNDALPAFLEQVKQGEVSALDGQMLTEMMHQMGINIRYLGRLASLAKEGSASPPAAAVAAPAAGGATGVPTPTTSTTTTPTAEGGGAGKGEDGVGVGVGSMERRFRAPAHLVQLCEMEMAARAAKHIIFDLLKDRADLRAAPAPTVVAVLNAVLGGRGGGGGGGSDNSSSSSSSSSKKGGGAASDAADATPTSPELAGATSSASSNGGGGKKKGKKAAKAIQHLAAGGAASAALPSQAQPRVAPPPSAGKTPEELRALILQDIKVRYRYASPTLLAHHLSGPTAAPWAVANPNALLRRLCQKLGLRVAARAYDWGSKEPVGLGDLVDIQPVAKHSAPAQPCEQAKELLDAARVLARQGSLNHAYDCAQEAAALYQQVGGAGVRCCLGGFFSSSLSSSAVAAGALLGWLGVWM
jgi:hypothetical protein